MFLIHLLFWLVFLYVMVTTLYLVILTFAAWFFRKRQGPGVPNISMAVVIPAHNEALGIEKVIGNIKACGYHDDARGIVVIADNCEDDTAQLARSAGARVVERTDPANRGKGQALDWFFKTRKDLYTRYDAVVIMDADTLAHPRFLAEMALSLSDPGIMVAQGYYGVSNPEDNWRTALSSAALNVFHHVRPAGRNRIGGTAGLKGNGMAFRTHILKRYGWPAYSIVEDIEFSMILLRDGILVHYNPDAIVYGEMATEKKQAETQRKRWEGGRFQVFRTYGPKLLKMWLEDRKKIAFLDGFMELFTTPLSLLVMGQLLYFVVSPFLYPSFFGVSLWCLLGTAFYVFSGLILKKASPFVWKSLFSAPFFILLKKTNFLKIVQKKDSSTWERTRRKSELEKRD